MAVSNDITPQERTYWTWQGHPIHYVQQGQQGPCLLLIHGFGASTDHWRQNIEVLSQHYRVWAIDLLGFGRSLKPALTYSADLWCEQIREFCIDQIKEPVFIAGNSLGGYVSLCFAADQPEWVRGVILLNCAGPFAEEGASAQPTWKQAIAQLTQQAFQLPGAITLFSFVLFLYTRRRSQIRKILLQVYKNPEAVTDRLVEEIYQPALDTGALQVFAAVFKSPPGRKLDQLLVNLQRPLLLLWGEADPWMTPGKAEKMRRLYPTADLQYLDAGHCPHDECPEEVNAAIQSWIRQLSLKPVTDSP